MKRTERHHLKENELAHLATAAGQAIEARRNQVVWGVALVVVAAVAVLGTLVWRERQQSQAQAALAEAMTIADAQVSPAPAPGSRTAGLRFDTVEARATAALPKFQAAADRFPSSETGVFARYKQAATLMLLGKPADAAKAYQQVIDAAPDALYGQMARLGLAQAQVRSGQADQAITAFKTLADLKDGPLPVDGILMELGRAYIEAGKASEAQQTFNRVVQEFPGSSFAADARRALDTLKKS